MPAAHALLQNLAMVLCVAGVTTVLFQRLRLPVVFGYLVAGMLLGPHVPLPLVADEDMLRTLSELGVTLLMFSIGLEFSLRRVLQVGAAAGLAALAESTAMLGLGYAAGRVLGWGVLASVFLGGTVAISSTTIIAKAFAEQQVRGRVTQIVFGMLIVEDLIAILLIAGLSAAASGGGWSAGAALVALLRLTTFLVGLVGIGMLVVPRLIRAVVRLERDETTLVASMGICFAAALLAVAFGYSVALGAFVAGSLVAESGVERTVDHLVRPVRDVFVAIFFVAVGMLIDPAVLAAHWAMVLGLVLLVVVGKTITVTTGAFLAGNGLRTSVQAGMSLAQIGEFSFIIASLGLATGVTGTTLYPVIVAVSAITTLTTPWLIRAAGPTASLVDSRLPRPLQTFVALYGSWMERLGATPMSRGGRDRIRQLVRLLLLDALLLVGVAAGAAAEMGRVTILLHEFWGVDDRTARLIVLLGAVAIGIPLTIGLLRTSRRLGSAIAERALPVAEERRVDFAAAPRRALVAALQLAIVLAVGAPLVVIVQLFLPPAPGALVLGVVALALGIAVWRSALNLQGHARAGAQAIVAALAQRLPRQVPADDDAALTDLVARVRSTLPGLGEPVAVRLLQGSRAVNRSLADLNIRGLTGATVLCIGRGDEQIVVPSGRETLRPGDIIALAGSHEGIDAARDLLVGPPGPTGADAGPQGNDRRVREV